MDIVLLGTASAACGVDRDNTYFVIRGGPESTILVDVGGNPLGKLKKLNIPVEEVSDVVFTHFHTDHIYGFPSLLWGMWLAGRTRTLTVHCSEEDKDRLGNWLKWIETDRWPMQFDIRIRAYEWRKPGVVFDRDELTISTFPSIHSAPTVGLKMSYRDKVAVYSADTELNSRIQMMDRIDVLIHEATTAEQAASYHTNLKGLTDYYDFEKIRRVVAVHLTDSEPYEEVLNGLAPTIRTRIELGCDLMTITL